RRRPKRADATLRERRLGAARPRYGVMPTAPPAFILPVNGPHGRLVHHNAPRSRQFLRPIVVLFCILKHMASRWSYGPQRMVDVHAQSSTGPLTTFPFRHELL